MLQSEEISKRGFAKEIKIKIMWSEVQSLLFDVPWKDVQKN